jgi:hypothetical protein
LTRKKSDKSARERARDDAHDRSLVAFFEVTSRKLVERTSRLREQMSESLAEEHARQEALQDRAPLPPSKWIENDYFSGFFARDMFDKLKEEFCDVYERNVFEIVLGGGIGYGKTWFSLVVQCYSMYLLTCYGIPQRAFRQMVETATILYQNMNVNHMKAKNSYFVGLDATLKSIPYFQTDFPLTPNLVNEIRIPQKRILCRYSGATKTAAESENLIFCVLDEINLYERIERSKRSDREDASYDAADVIYTSALRRMLNRYMLPDESMPLPAKMILLCKETHPDSFIRKRIKHARKTGEEERGRVKIMEYAEWDTRPASDYGKSYFWIRTATRTESAKVIENEGEAERERKAIESMSHDDRKGSRVVRVPSAREGGRYLALAKKNLPGFIRDTCGIATDAIQEFFDRSDVIFLAHRTERDWPVWACDHPFTAHTTNFFDGVSFKREMICEWSKEYNEWRPRQNPDAPRFVGIDTSITGDPSSIAMGHVHGFKRVLRRGEGSQAIYEQRPIIWMDAMLSILPPSNGEIPYAAIRSMVLTWKEFGFRILNVGLDTHQRIAITQPLEAHGLKWERVSTDMTTVPMEQMRAAYYEERMLVYPYPPFEGELRTLERINTGRIMHGQPVEKIDHPEHSTKDIVDSVARVVYMIESHVTSPLYHAGTTVVERTSHVKTKMEREYEKQRLYEEGNWDELMRITRREEEEL